MPSLIPLSPVSARFNRREAVRLAAIAGLATSAFARLAPGHVSAADDLAVQMKAMLADAVAGGVPGACLRVEQDGVVLFSGAAGVSNLDSQTPMLDDDQFRIYSITKTFVAVVVLQLVDDDVLSLDDSVSKWLDDPAVLAIPNVDAITIRQLLTHTSGIYDFADDNDSPFWEDAFLGPEADWTKVWTVPELLAYADGARHAPYFAPGEGVAYSNTGYLLLGLVVEAATGNTFADELADRILLPLDLFDTLFSDGGTVPASTVGGYQNLDGEIVDVGMINLSWVWTAGGIVSTTSDLATFARALFNGELLSAESQEAMFTFPDEGERGMQYGMGVIRSQTDNGAIVGMDGGSAGANSTMQLHEASKALVIVLLNLAPDDGATDKLRDGAIAGVLAAGS